MMKYPPFYSIPTFQIYRLLLLYSLLVFICNFGANERPSSRPLCPWGNMCIQVDHHWYFDHDNLPTCDYGNNCSNLSLGKHFHEKQHPPLPRCGYYDDCVELDQDPEHGYLYSHRCPAGNNCTDRSKAHFYRFPSHVLGPGEDTSSPENSGDGDSSEEDSVESDEGYTHPQQFPSPYNHQWNPNHRTPPPITSSAAPMHSPFTFPQQHNFIPPPIQHSPIVLPRPAPTIVLPPVAVLPPEKQICSPFCQIAEHSHKESFMHFCNFGVHCRFHGRKDKAHHFQRFRHPCRLGANCTLINDRLHTLLMVHPCTSGAKCTQNNQSHPQHVYRFTHPCTNDNCLFTSDLVHTLLSTHVCNTPQCPKIDDEGHLLSYRHECPHGAGCPQQPDKEHSRRFNHPPVAEANTDAPAAPAPVQASVAPVPLPPVVVVTPCPNTVFCPSLDDVAHCAAHSHPSFDIPNNGGKITLVSKKEKKLINPLVNRGADQWKHSPYSKVSLIANPQRSGLVLGHEMKDKNSATGKIVVKWVSGGPVLIEAVDQTLIKCNSQPHELNTPWFHENCVLFASTHVTRVFDLLLNAPVVGLGTTTFMDVFRALNAQGIPVFVMGGAVRDLVHGAQKDSIKDIDVSFGCTNDELIAICNQQKWLYTPPTAFGLFQFGTQNAPNTLYLEGKTIGATNFDSTALPGVPTSMGCALHAEAKYRDFALNALYYDPFNQVIIDPTGKGVPDAINSVLRIPVDLTDNTLSREWVLGNPTKIGRYWKFLLRKFTCDPATLAFILLMAKDKTIVPINEWRKMQTGMKKAYGAQHAHVVNWKAAVIQDLGFDPGFL